MTPFHRHAAARHAAARPALPADVFEAALSSSPIPSLVMDPDGVVAMANAAATDLLGGIVAGGEWTSLIEPEGRDRLARFVAAAVAGDQRCLRAEMEFRGPDGCRIVGLTNASLLPAVWDGPPLILVQIHDVTARHETEEALRASEERYRTLFERMPVAQYRSRPDGVIVDANPALASLLGCDDPQDLIGRNAVDFYLEPGERDHLVSELVATGRSATDATCLRTADGRLIWIRDTAHTVGSGDDMLFEGSLVDITAGWNAHLEIEARVRQQESIAGLGRFALSRAELDCLFDEAVLQVVRVLDVDVAAIFLQSRPGAPAAIAMTDTAAAVRLAEHLDSASAVCGSVAFDTIEVDGTSVRAANLGICGRDGRLGALVIGRNDRHEFTADDDSYLLAVTTVLAAAIEGDAGRRQLETMVESKDEFIASVSHEVRTPLTVVAGMAQELAERWQSFSPEEIDEFLGLILEQSRDMRDLIEDLLVAARADLGKIQVQLAPTPLLPEVWGVVAAMPRADRERIRVVDTAATGLVDPVRFRQIVRNLLTNAIRYGGPHIEVEIAAAPDEVTVVVGDDGQGVPDDKRELIFEAFEGAHQGVVAGSIGLGLAVSRRLAELMGGHLDYEHEGRSTFSLVVRRAGKD